MQGFDFELFMWINLSFTTLAFFPLFFFIKYYFRTKILDFLLFAGVFGSVIITQYSFTIISELEKINTMNLIVQIINFVSFGLIWSLIFIHALRIKFFLMFSFHIA
jgi:hypothetical protein